MKQINVSDDFLSDLNSGETTELHVVRQTSYFTRYSNFRLENDDDVEIA